VATNVGKNKPYDHIFIEKTFKTLLKIEDKISIIDLLVETGITKADSTFYQQYSDHNPVYFDIKNLNVK